jgi:hypothetical protein
MLKHNISICVISHWRCWIVELSEKKNRGRQSWRRDMNHRLRNKYLHVMATSGMPAAACSLSVSQSELSHSLHTSLFFPHYPISVLLQCAITRNDATVTQRDMWKGQSWTFLNTSTVIITCANSLDAKAPYFTNRLNLICNSSNRTISYCVITDHSLIGSRTLRSYRK